MKNRHFDISFSTSEGSDEHLFLSVTPGFEHGPGIQRDGISSPRMTDPHTVPAILNSRKLDPSTFKSTELPATSDAFVQRSGTWTVYHHLKNFYNTHDENWRVIAIQSNGDLTMNYWHVAYIQREGRPPSLCGLRTNGDPQEPVGMRVYHCLVKWNTEASVVRGRTYEYLDLKFEPIIDERWAVKTATGEKAKELDEAFSNTESYDLQIHDLGPLIEFALAGKPIIKNGIEIPFSNAIDKFQDIRHVFNLPNVDAAGHYHGHNVVDANFGEYQLFKNINERRAALLNPIVIDLDIEGHVTTKKNVVIETLIKRHYTKIFDSPTRRGQFREYSDGKIEIFFQHNVYPFGVFGIRSAEEGSGSELVSLSSGGLSGRVGNTLEGITQIMFDFFSCSDAMILDEGFDVFALSNLNIYGTPKYSNKELLKRVCAFSMHQLDLDAKEAKISNTDYPLGDQLTEWPLNIRLAKDLETDFKEYEDSSYEDILMVPPLRSQMRSVLIYAVRV